MYIFRKNSRKITLLITFSQAKIFINRTPTKIRLHIKSTEYSIKFSQLENVFSYLNEINIYRFSFNQRSGNQ